MKIEPWVNPNSQCCNLGDNEWNVARLIWLSRDLPVMDIPLDHLNIYYTYEKISLRGMVTHINAVNDADLDKPIILDEDGELMDGRHRIMKALLLGNTTIKAVRFDENPAPDRIIA